MLGLRPREIRHRLERDGLEVDASPPDPASADESPPSEDSTRNSYPAIQISYNVAPAYTEPIYRAVQNGKTGTPQYELTPARWGLIPSWETSEVEGKGGKTSFNQSLKTINCRDDSLLKTTGLWNSVKHQRCVVPAQGFYEWLNNGKEKVASA